MVTSLPELHASTTEQGAKVPVAFATLTADGPTGGFFGENGVIAW
jgi:hypothetical protein